VKASSNLGKADPFKLAVENVEDERLTSTADVHNFRRFGWLEKRLPLRRAVYLMAVHTGLRRSELAALLWRFVKLDAPRPHLHLPGEFTKNGEDAILLLHPDVVAVLGR
jgi:integrase